MNNKYDIGKFAKILEDFNLESELTLVDQFLFGGEGKPRFVPQVANPKFEFVPYTGGFDVNKLSQADLREPTQHVRDAVIVMDDEEVLKLVEHVISKIFCAG